MHTGLKALVAALCVAGFVGAAPLAQASTAELTPKANQDYLAASAAKPGTVVRPSGLQYRIIKSGPANGKTPAATDMVVVTYSGALINGEVFDRSRPNTPVTFAANGVIPGWVEALSLMKPGDEWELVIPANLAYGANGYGAAVPPNQTLVFRVQLIAVK